MNIRTLSTYILQALAQAQMEGRLSNLETLRDELQVRRTDIRKAVSQLHREGMLDVLRMRLTLAGFAIGRALAGETLPPLRKPASPVVVKLNAA
jgi:DNA-binding GntR family transcriptional regulator